MEATILTGAEIIMKPISGMEKLSLNTEPLARRLENRDTSFARRLTSAVTDVNLKQNQADDAIAGVIRGEVGIHEGLMTVGKADTSLRLLIAVRSKVMAAYNEIMRMQI